MAPKPLEVLKKGLAKFMETIKKELGAKLRLMQRSKLRPHSMIWSLQGHFKRRMDIESLLNPVGESHILTETSDKEIYQAVMDSIMAHENIEINGGDDVNEDDIPIEPRPTLRVVLKAVSTISRYAEDLNYPLPANSKHFWAHSIGNCGLKRPRV